MRAIRGCLLKLTTILQALSVLLPSFILSSTRKQHAVDRSKLRPSSYLDGVRYILRPLTPFMSSGLTLIQRHSFICRFLFPFFHRLVSASHPRLYGNRGRCGIHSAALYPRNIFGSIYGQLILLTIRICACLETSPIPPFRRYFQAF